VDISLQEAISLLRKWQEERRMIQCALFAPNGTSCSLIGRIEHVEPDTIRIDATSRDKLGRFIGMSLRASKALGFSFEDWRDAPEEHANALRQAYETFLFVNFYDGSHCEIYAAKFGDEL
jgi:hypothetical protein